MVCPAHCLTEKKPAKLFKLTLKTAFLPVRISDKKSKQGEERRRQEGEGDLGDRRAARADKY